jgi:tetratricopeptide (TPR) repeat protein
MGDRRHAAAVGIGLAAVAVFAPLLRYGIVLLEPIPFGVPFLEPRAALVLHAVNAALVLLLLVRLTGTLLPSALATALFALHPLRVESIAWIASGHDLPGMTATLATLLAYEGWARRAGWWRYAAAIVAYAVAVAVTPLAAPLPLILLLLDAWPLARLDPIAPAADPRLGRRLAEQAPFVLVAALGLAFATAPWVVPAEPAPLAAAVANGFANVVRYLGMILVPAGLSPLRPATPPPWWAPGAVLAIVGATAATVATRRRAPGLTIGWLWFLLALLPVLGRVPADRFTYLPSIGLGLAIAWMLGASGRHRRAVTAMALVAVAVVVAATERQVTTWRDTETVLRHAVAVTADNFLAERSLGAELVGRGAWDEAAIHVAEAVRLRPDDPEALAWLGAVRLHEGHVDAAVEAATTALTARPDLAYARTTLAHAELRRGRPDAAIAAYRTLLADGHDELALHAGLAHALRQRGRLDDAREHFERALALGAPPADVLGPLAQTLAEAGDLDAAAERYRQLLDLTPDDATARHRLGTIAVRRGDLEAAETEYRAALRLAPGLAEARMHLGIVLAARGALLEALDAYDAALAAAPRLPTAQYNRALALEAAGKPDAAREAFRAELVVQPEWPPALLRLALLLAAGDSADRAEADRLVTVAATALGDDDPDVQAVRRRLRDAAPGAVDSP